VAAIALPAAAAAVPTGSAWHFQSQPKLQPPKLAIEHRGSIAGGGLLFLDPFKDFAITHPEVGQAGALIADAQGNPLWFQAAPNGEDDVDLHADTIGGRSVLAFWQGKVATTPGAPVPIGEPEAGARWLIIDQHYHRVATLAGADGWTPDLHELIGGPGDDVVYAVARTVKADLSAYGGPAAGAYEDNGFQELDLATGKVVATWDMSQHVSLSQSVTAPLAGGVWDPYHLNSIRFAPDGSLVVSARNTWSVYDVSPSGVTNWTLDAKPSATDSSFTFGTGAAFAWQHDAALQPNGELTMFDDHCCALGGTVSQPLPSARGLILRLSTSTHTATLARAYPHTPPLVVPTQGSMQLLSGGDALVDWGQQPLVSEYSGAGKLLWEAALPAADSTYRATTARWTGLPSTKPVLAIRHRASAADLYVSWNGATTVSRWQILYGASKRRLRSLGVVSRHGFETVVHVRDVTGGYFQVRALGANGRSLGTSRSAHA
jgi:hypothetical protein